jgi:hypothetical protein
MVKNLKGKDVFLFLVFGFLAIVLSVYVYAETKINYLPRNQNIESLKKRYTPVLVKNELPCAGNMFSQIALCNRCVQVLKPGCPDCCFNFGATAATRYPKCTSSADTNGCTWSKESSACVFGVPPANTGNPPVYCSCPSTKPVKPSCGWMGCWPPLPATLNCTQNTTAPAKQIWYCNYENYLASTSCLNKMTGLVKRDIKCDFYDTGHYKSKDFYEDIEELDSVADAGIFAYYNLTGRRWKYEPKKNFIDCQKNCQVQKAKEDACNAKDLSCKAAVCPDQACQPAVCSPPDPDGFDKFCNSGPCSERNVVPDCDNDTTNTCAALNTQAADCLKGFLGCDCFQEIDQNNTFNYEFLGKTNESITFIWQIDTTSASSSSVSPPPPMSQWPPYYFYTKLRVFDRANIATPVWESVINQKQLATSFNIYGADRISGLTPGHRYVAKLYYFLPSPPKALPALPPYFTLRMQVNSMSITAIKVRE